MTITVAPGVVEKVMDRTRARIRSCFERKTSGAEAGRMGTDGVEEASEAPESGNAAGRGDQMRVVVDLNRCQSYGQCVFAAPEVFELRGDEILEYEYAPDDSLREKVERARAYCPVQAIKVGWAVEQKVGRDDGRERRGGE